MGFCKEITNAKCCIVSIAEAYVKASTIGANTEGMLNELLLLNSYVEALCRYDCDPKRKVEKTIFITNNGILLSANNKILSLKSCYTECVDPDEVNCLTEEEVCFILQQIRLRCDSCECGC